MSHGLWTLEPLKLLRSMRLLKLDLIHFALPNDYKDWKIMFKHA